MDVTVVLGEHEWDGLYVDGKLKVSDHSLYWAHVLDALGIEYKILNCPNSYLEAGLDYPDSIEDLRCLLSLNS